MAKRAGDNFFFAAMKWAPLRMGGGGMSVHGRQLHGNAAHGCYAWLTDWVRAAYLHVRCGTIFRPPGGVDLCPGQGPCSSLLWRL